METARQEKRLTAEQMRAAAEEIARAFWRRATDPGPEDGDIDGGRFSMEIEEEVPAGEGLWATYEAVVSGRCADSWHELDGSYWCDGGSCETEEAQLTGIRCVYDGEEWSLPASQEEELIRLINSM